MIVVYKDDVDEVLFQVDLSEEQFDYVRSRHRIYPKITPVAGSVVAITGVVIKEGVYLTVNCRKAIPDEIHWYSKQTTV